MAWGKWLWPWRWTGRDRGQGKRIYCHYPYTSLWVDPEGQVRPCCYTPVVGDLRRQTVEEIWNGDPLRRMRRALARGELEAAGCGQCSFRGRRDVESFPRREDQGQAPAIAQNIARQRQEYLQGAEYLQSRPSFLLLQATETCNYRCRMCFQEHKPRELSPALRERALALLPVVDEIQFTGGEPFLSAWVQDFLRRFDPRRGQKLSFTTNGSLLHRFRAELERLPRLHLGVSLDAATAATYHHIRRGGNWEQVKANVEWLARQRHQRRPLWDTCRLAYVVMRSNYQEILDFLRWVRRLEMPVMFCPVWGERAREEDIFRFPHLRRGLCPPGQILEEATRLLEGMPPYEYRETITSLRWTLAQLEPWAPTEMEGSPHQSEALPADQRCQPGLHLRG